MRYWLPSLFDVPEEQVIAASRLTLAVIATVALTVDPPHLAANAAMTYAVLLIYLVYASACVLLVFPPGRDPSLAYLLHGLDITAVAALLYLTDGPTSPFFVFFTFLLIAATLRWNWRGALITALLLAIVFVAVAGVQDTPENPRDHLGRVIVRAGFLVVGAAMLAYFGAHRERSRSRLAKLAAWPAQDQGAGDPAPGAAVLAHVATLTSAAAVLVVWSGPTETRHLAQWKQGALERLRARLPAELVHPRGFSGRIAATGSLASDNEASVEPRLHRAMATAFPMRECLTAAFELSSCRGRIFLLDPPPSGDDEAALAELIAMRIGVDLQQEIVRQQLARAAAHSERARLARDLHDGVLQTLTGASLHLRVAQRTAPPKLRHDLELIGAALVAEQRNVRSFVEGSRGGADVAGQDVSLLGEHRERLGKVAAVWGCRLDYAEDMETLRTSGRLAADLVFILSEATANASRHGGASTIHVCAARTSGGVRLQIRDNGNGFEGLNGRFTGLELRRLGVGPRSIRDRVEDLGGSLVLHSGPTGSALDIELPDA